MICGLPSGRQLATWAEGSRKGPGLEKGSGSISISAEGSWEERGVIDAKMAQCFWAAVRKATERLKRVCWTVLGKSRVNGIRWRNELRGQGRPAV